MALHGIAGATAGMNIEIGIIGLPQSGRTTVFSALTGGQAATGRQPREGEAHVGVAPVKDPRLERLAGVLRPEKVVPASISYLDVGASVKGLAEGKGIGGRLLSRLSTVDALINVVRDFRDERIPHVEGSVDAARDIAAMDLELAFSDLLIVERRLGRIADSLKGAKPDERAVLRREQELLEKVRAGLEAEVPVRRQGLSPEELRLINHFQLLTAKPMLVVVNIGEESLAGAAAIEERLGASAGGPPVVALCGRLEVELAGLDEESARTWRAEFGLTVSGPERVVAESYRLLDLVTFFTGVSSEVRAWPVPAGTPAPVAAGKIHSDMERGFIRAEVIGVDELVACGGLAEARRRGRLRLEGKTYLVQDGDFITFLFNV